MKKKFNIIFILLFSFKINFIISFANDINTDNTKNIYNVANLSDDIKKEIRSLLPKTTQIDNNQKQMLEKRKAAFNKAAERSEKILHNIEQNVYQNIDQNTTKQIQDNLSERVLLFKISEEMCENNCQLSDLPISLMAAYQHIKDGDDKILEYSKKSGYGINTTMKDKIDKIKNNIKISDNKNIPTTVEKLKTIKLVEDELYPSIEQNIDYKKYEPSITDSKDIKNKRWEDLTRKEQNAIIGENVSNIKITDWAIGFYNHSKSNLEYEIEHINQYFSTTKQKQSNKKLNQYKIEILSKLNDLHHFGLINEIQFYHAVEKMKQIDLKEYKNAKNKIIVLEDNILNEVINMPTNNNTNNTSGATNKEENQTFFEIMMAITQHQSAKEYNKKNGFIDNKNWSDMTEDEKNIFSLSHKDIFNKYKKDDKLTDKIDIALKSLMNAKSQYSEHEHETDIIKEHELILLSIKGLYNCGVLSASDIENNYKKQLKQYNIKKINKLEPFDIQKLPTLHTTVTAVEKNINNNNIKESVNQYILLHHGQNIYQQTKEEKELHTIRQIIKTNKNN